MIQGWYYLHENKELIYKSNPDAIEDIRDSDLCHASWAWDGERSTAWKILVEALSLGAKKERIFELAGKWKCNDEDAQNYANYLGVQLDIDGSAMTAKRIDFIDLQESYCGFGETYLEALADLCKQHEYCGGKLGWHKSFAELMKV